MKKLFNVFKVALIVALTVTVSAVSAQKAGRVSVQDIIMSMPETAAMQTELETISKDYSDNLETMQVELNNKLTDFQQNASTMNESIRSLKEKDMQDLNTRMQQFEQNARQELQVMQNKLLEPIIEKARTAISDVAKSGGYMVVYDEGVGALAYYDDSVTDLTPAVKTKLGIK